MIKTIYGTKDILPNVVADWNFIENLVRNHMCIYNYKEIRTPVFEETVLFKRGIGESSILSARKCILSSIEVKQV